MSKERIDLTEKLCNQQSAAGCCAYSDVNVKTALCFNWIVGGFDMHVFRGGYEKAATCKL